jgi:plasmid stabilization system protein ParE
MSWRVEFHAEVQRDVEEATIWYDSRKPGLGAEFVEEVIRVWDALAENPQLHSRRHPTKNIRWRYPDRFPYRIIYEVLESEQTVIVVAVLHAARDDRHWQSRL